jgi:hypothetical protein
MFAVRPDVAPSQRAQVTDDLYRTGDELNEAFRSGDKAAMDRLNAEEENLGAKRRELS